ncbi:hypothetical protein AA103196_0669 [Ameyamaea chiangmaiensis NBRC 103196]|nr:hypothetical protein AA103196_0669 [Ameyamaea chiangmaiensis NBRC 103196]
MPSAPPSMTIRQVVQDILRSPFRRHGAVGKAGTRTLPPFVTIDRSHQPIYRRFRGNPIPIMATCGRPSATQA